MDSHLLAILPVFSLSYLQGSALLQPGDAVRLEISLAINAGAWCDTLLL